MSGMDYNVDNYTITELLEILELEDPTSEQIIDSTNKLINRFTKENRGQMVNFFQNIQTKLLQYMNQLETTGRDAEYEPNEKQTQDWIEYQALPQDNPVQRDKNTDRVQKIDIYDNIHVPMNREQLGVNNNYEVPVVQDTLNPNLKNVTSRFINIDSQFRQASGGIESVSTDFTLDLSDPLTDVLSLRLYSIQIPYTWYAIDYNYGNTCFWVTNKGDTFRILIEPGNYTPSEFCSALNMAFLNAGFTYPSSPEPSIATFNSNNGKITLKLDNWLDPNGNTIVTIEQFVEIFKSDTHSYFTFFDVTGAKTCYTDGTYSCSSASQNHTFNGTLGWLMGFRLPIQPIFTGGNTPVSILNLYGTKYFILVLDDYNQNHINNGLITITELSKSLSLPSYYNTSQPFICNNVTQTLPSILDIDAVGNLANINSAEASSLGLNLNNLFNSIQDKVDFGLGKIPTVLPSAPRTLTQAQIYTINEIIKNRTRTISFRAKAPTNSDTFAIIPIKYGSMSTGQLYTELSGQFQDNKRTYFGPVDIQRMRVRLLDDKGNVVDLHDADWCITLISENLYQY
jgi:hypothetical protein